MAIASSRRRMSIRCAKTGFGLDSFRTSGSGRCGHGLVCPGSPSFGLPGRDPGLDHEQARGQEQREDCGEGQAAGN